MALFGIGIIGCGAMGTALARGIAASGAISPADLWIYDLDKQKADAAAGEMGLQTAAGPEELFGQCRYIFVAVKPQDVAAAVDSWKDLYRPGVHLLISLAAGVTIKFYEERLPAGSKVIRLMPNTPCLIGEGAVAMSAGSAVSPEEAAAAGQLLSHLGLTVPVPESLMDAVTGLSGSGPAYVYLFVEALIDAGVTAGLNREIAAKLAVQTVLGAARMLQESGRHPAELRNEVTSPAGTTAAALAVLEKGSFRGDLIAAVMAATERAGELKRE
ncbi:MAG: pyrroline-5-carboxylate reductase [Dethiobacteria bacterium]|nr:pyrroline-5-carboxylate reductase [Bacillota bacterium]NMD32405.1 pyrroline-5-carboxylate reductase [Bacillota bacterium]HOB28976.1 pyrroline-5-carboxylate reductase [Bacillota bacterium]HPZ41540.1 pyrroline-5-carboxylate reductase [Bacillota bacterium]HQD52504.1 pyrroline-5-carboxylate reductase [Bacillota bacterium]